MQYILLVYSDESKMQGLSEDEAKAVMGAWHGYTEDLQKSGGMQAGDALQPTPTATTVRVANGETQTTDGPFAETKEQLGGYYIIEAKDLDEAIEWSAKMPHVAHGGSVEVRPVMVYD